MSAASQAPLARTRLVGIDLGGTSIKAGAITRGGEILERRVLPLELERGADDVLDRLAQVARELGALDGVGVGTPGLIDRARGRLLECPNLHALQGRDLRDEIARRLACSPRTVLLENDANVAALGERWLGAGRGEDDFLLVTLGTGIGGGVVLGGKLQRGAGGMAGEIGHVVIDPDGLACGCGARGCLETLASASAASRRARAAGLPATRPGDLITLSELARRANGPERALLFDIGRDLGRGLACAVSLLDVRCFILGGGFGAATDALTPGIEVGVRERCYGSRLSQLRILQACLGPDAGWIGAASLCLSDDRRAASSAQA